MSTATEGIGVADVVAAGARIAPYVHRTPVLTSETLNHIAGARLAFKGENFQKVGAFKARGAHNAVFLLPPERASAGVVTHSSGNHAAALALAARNRGIPAHIVMPENAPRPKVESVRRLEGRVTLCAPTLAAREAAAAALLGETGATLVHPSDNAAVIAGQGTAALELLGVRSDLDAVVVPVGGGGLLAGTAIAAKGLRPSIRVYGVEPAAVDDGLRSFRSGMLQPPTGGTTIADGLRTSLGPVNFPIIQDLVDDIVTVSEDEILHAMQLVWSVMKTVIEPSSAVAVAALLERRLPVEGQEVGVILTGGNVDLTALPWLQK